MSGLTGKVVITAARLHLQSRERAGELQGRLLPSVPTGWIEGYGVALLLGLLSWRRTSGWWQRLWPQEQRRDYANAFGLQAARAARGLVMLTLFLPVAGIAAVPSLLSGWRKRGTTIGSTSVHAGKPQSAPSGANR